jgi:pimeloyl-ACP methyl ester carboxylesterase
MAVRRLDRTTGERVKVRFISGDDECAAQTPNADGPVAARNAQQMRIRPLRRFPMAFGWLARRGNAATARWVKTVMKNPEIRRDAVRVLRGVEAEPLLMLNAAECLPSLNRPALVVWASGDRVMPPRHGRRLAGLLPQAAGRDERQRHAHPAGPASQARPDDPGVPPTHPAQPATDGSPHDQWRPGPEPRNSGG